MSNKRVYVKALLRGPWVIMPGDEVRSTMMSTGVLRHGEVAKVLHTYYIEVPFKDSDEVSHESWVDLEIVKPSVGVPAAMGLQVSEYADNLVPAGYVIGAGRGNGGRTFDQFVEEYVALSLTVATYEHLKDG